MRVHTNGPTPYGNEMDSSQNLPNHTREQLDNIKTLTNKKHTEVYIKRLWSDAVCNLKHISNNKSQNLVSTRVHKRVLSPYSSQSPIVSVSSCISVMLGAKQKHISARTGQQRYYTASAHSYRIFRRWQVISPPPSSRPLSRSNSWSADPTRPKSVVTGTILSFYYT